MEKESVHNRNCEQIIRVATPPKKFNYSPPTCIYQIEKLLLVEVESEFELMKRLEKTDS